MRGSDSKAIPSEELSTLHLRHECNGQFQGKVHLETPVNGNEERRGTRHMLAKRSSDKISNVGNDDVEATACHADLEFSFFHYLQNHGVNYD